MEETAREALHSSSHSSSHVQVRDQEEGETSVDGAPRLAYCAFQANVLNAVLGSRVLGEAHGLDGHSSEILDEHPLGSIPEREAILLGGPH